VSLSLGLPQGSLAGGPHPGLVAVRPVRDDGGVTTPSEPTSAAPSAAAPPRSRYSMGSGSNMARSLLVVLALVAGLIALVPRVDSVRQPAVDAASVVSYAVKDSGTPFLFPTGLPSGWTATSARYATSTDSLPTWQAGWTTPAGQFVGLRQALNATPAWISTGITGGKVTGSVEMSGRTWEMRTDERNQLYAVSVSAEKLTTVVSATGGMDDIRFFVDTLKPAKAAN